jgi:hypothetical protein
VAHVGIGVENAHRTCGPDAREGQLDLLLRAFEDLEEASSSYEKKACHICAGCFAAQGEWQRFNE